MELTFKLIDGMLVAAIDPKQAEEIGIKVGVKYVVRKTADGVELTRPDMQTQLEIARHIIQKDHAVLAELAK